MTKAELIEQLAMANDESLIGKPELTRLFFIYSLYEKEELPLNIWPLFEAIMALSVAISTDDLCGKMRRMGERLRAGLPDINVKRIEPKHPDSCCCPTCILEMNMDTISEAIGSSKMTIDEIVEWIDVQKSQG